MTKKKGPATNAPTKSKTTSSRAMTKVAPTFATPREGTSANPEVALGLNISGMENPAVVEKSLHGLILSVDKEAMEKLELD